MPSNRTSSSGGSLAAFWLVVVETIVVAFEVLTQKLRMLSLAPLERIGMEADSPGAVGSGTVCIVTGPTSGIGREIATEMYRRGYIVVLACRNREKGEQLSKELEDCIEYSYGCQKVQPRVEILDVSSLESVRRFAERWNDQIRLPVHALINNAGIFSMSSPREATADGFESHMGTNYLGHFLLTHSMLPWLKKARQESGRPARVVNVASKLHRMGRLRTGDPHFLEEGSFNSLAAYSQSKLAQVMFAKEYSRRYDGVVQCLSVHPGEVLTDVVRSLPGALQQMYRVVMRLFLLTPAQGMPFIHSVGFMGFHRLA
jgi:retinol dehydrogenase-12